MEDFAPLLERAFALDPREQEYTIEASTGEVPDFVEGRITSMGRPDSHGRDCGTAIGSTVTAWSVPCGSSVTASLHQSLCEDAQIRRRGKGRSPSLSRSAHAFPADQMKRGIALESPERQRLSVSWDAPGLWRTGSAVGTRSSDARDAWPLHASGAAERDQSLLGASED